MRKIFTNLRECFFIVLMSTCCASAFSQNGVAINTTGAAANSSAMLDISSTTGGLLIPRMLSSDRTTISAPATGLLVYQTDGLTGFYYYNGSSWTLLSTSASTVTGVTASSPLSSSGGITPNISLTGIVPIANGGTNNSSIGAAGTVVYSNGTQHVFTSVGSNGQVLTLSGGAPTWATPTTGTVTSVGLTLPIIFTVSGSPITTSGTLTGTLTSESANTVFAAPNGLAGAPTFRPLVAADIPSLAGSYIQNQNASIQTPGTFNIAGSGSLVGITNTSTLTSSGGIISLNAGSNFVTNINTGTSTGNVTIGNSLSSLIFPKFSTAGTVFYTTGAGTVNGLTPGSNGQVLTLSAGAPTWATPTTGTVTSVGLTLPSIFTVSGSPITTSGTLTGTLTSESANTVFAAPNGSAGVPTFRSLVAADLPSGNGNYIQNQIGSSQAAGYWISNPASIGTSTFVSTNELNVATSSAANNAIVGTNNASSGSNIGDGVEGFTAQSAGYGVWGVNTNGSGLSVVGQNLTLAGSGSGSGVYGSTIQSAGFGVGGFNSNSNGSGIIGVGNNITGFYLITGSGGAFTGSTIGAYSYHLRSTATGTNYVSPGAAGIYSVSSASKRGSSVSSYQFGVFGMKNQDFIGSPYFYDLRSGGVLGVSYDSTGSSISAWGAAGYLSSGQTYYGLYSSTSTTGGGTGFAGNISSSVGGIGIGSYGGLMGGWIRGIVYGLNVKGTRYGMYIDGYAYVNKPLVQLIDNGNNDKIVTYSVASTTPDIYAHGKGKLINGHAVVLFNKDFTDAIDPSQDISITVTPLGQSNGVYLEKSDAGEFSVQENVSSANRTSGSNVEFSWIAIGTRKDVNKNDIATEVLAGNYDKNMDKVMFDESDNTQSAKPIYWDGKSLNFNAPTKGLFQSSGQKLKAIEVKQATLQTSVNRKQLSNISSKTTSSNQQQPQKISTKNIKSQPSANTTTNKKPSNQK